MTAVGTRACPARPPAAVEPVRVWGIADAECDRQTVPKGR
jgi:hypothetical protein